MVKLFQCFEFVDEFLRFPGRGGVTYPLDQVLDFSVSASAIQDAFHQPFFIAFDNDWWGWGLYLAGQWIVGSW